MTEKYRKHDEHRGIWKRERDGQLLKGVYHLLQVGDLIEENEGRLGVVKSVDRSQDGSIVTVVVQS